MLPSIGRILLFVYDIIVLQLVADSKSDNNAYGTYNVPPDLSAANGLAINALMLLSVGTDEHRIIKVSNFTQFTNSYVCKRAIFPRSQAYNLVQLAKPYPFVLAALGIAIFTKLEQP